MGARTQRIMAAAFAATAFLALPSGRAQAAVTLESPLEGGTLFVVEGVMEAGVGIEPAYTDLQSAAWPLCHPARGGSNQKGKRVAPPRILEREKSLELATSTLARLRSTN